MTFKEFAKIVNDKLQSNPELGNLECLIYDTQGSTAFDLSGIETNYVSEGMVISPEDFESNPEDYKNYDYELCVTINGE